MRSIASLQSPRHGLVRCPDLCGRPSGRPSGQPGGESPSNRSLSGYVEQGQVTPLCRASTLALQIEYSADPDTEKDDQPRKLGYKVECLSTEDMSLARMQSQYPIIEAGVENFAISYPIAESRIFFIASPGGMMKVQLAGNS